MIIFSLVLMRNKGVAGLSRSKIHAKGTSECLLRGFLIVDLWICDQKSRFKTDLTCNFLDNT